MVKVRVVGIAVLVALVAVACGSRTDNSSSPDEGAEEQSSTTVAAQGSAEGMFGTIESPCGDGDASGATDVGVTDDAITITSVSDSGGQVGGLNKGVDDSAKAFVKWCNDQGGINGRQIKLEMRNAELFNYGSVVTQACSDSVSMVGGIAVFDDSGAQLQVDCGLPNVPAAAVSSIQAGADLTYLPLPGPPNQLFTGAAQWVREHYPHVITSAGMVRQDVASIDYIAKRVKEAYTSLGFNFIYDGVAAIGEANWSTFVIDMKAKGVEFMTLESSWEEIVNLQAAMAQQDFRPEVTQQETNFYQLQYPAKADGNAEGTYVQLTTWPFGEADDNPGMATYLQALEAAVPGAVPEQLGLQGWSAMLLWSTAVKSLGSDVTRANIADALADIHAWDGGGIQGTSDPGANKGSPCFILMQVQGDGFARVFPTKDADAATFEQGKGFSCNPDYIVDLTTDFDNGARAAN